MLPSMFLSSYCGNVPPHMIITGVYIHCDMLQWGRIHRFPNVAVHTNLTGQVAKFVTFSAKTSLMLGEHKAVSFCEQMVTNRLPMSPL